MSSVQLTQDEVNLLSRGLKFCPTPTHINRPELKADISDFIRRLRLHEYFHDENNNNNNNPSHDGHNPFRVKSNWTPHPGRDASLDAFSNTIEEQIVNARPTKIRDNLTKRERRALKRLIRREDIIIKPADKGSGTVVMDMDWYENECLRQLNDTQFYEKIDNDISPLTHECVKRYISGLQVDKIIDDETAKYLKENSPKPGRFYTIPKLHKQGHPGRPIVSSNSHPTERISQFVDFHLQPLVTKLPSYIKDTTHFLNKLNSIGQLPDGVLLVTLDVSSLYTNIPHNDGIQACSEFLDRRIDPTIPTTRLCDLIRMILTHNTFTFNGKYYRQINGTAMGTKMAPSYANLFMGKFEENALADASHSPLIWWRFIDDIFLLWTHGEDLLNRFITYLNNLHPTIKFTSSFSHSEISFLDVNVLLINGRLETDLYVKPTDKHQYLLKSSCHPSHTKQSIPFSMALRLRRICSTDEFFNTRSDALTTHLIKRGYPHRFIKEEIEKVRHIPRSKALETSMKNQSNRIPFVVTFNPALPNIRRIIFNNLNILRSSQRCKAAFPSPPLISYRRCKQPT